ncbi:MAG TPA: hypothetical protein VJJ23_04760 [Candidatus Nanoarchaeia archaeon]|nr:hypothetical protein [Candidatus Nanoarchaeia archaeon]
MIEDFQDKALEEMKRADHLVYVSLKYTRTADVIKSVIQRLINVFEMSFDEYLEFMKDTRKIKEIPGTKKEKITLIEKLVKEKISDYIRMYAVFKAIDKAEYTGREEYRKHVTLISHLPGKDFEVDYPRLLEFYDKTKEFHGLLHGLIK